MNSMFYGCSAFAADLSSWNTGQVLNMSAMFYDADAYRSNMSSWNLAKITTSAGLDNFMALATGLSRANYDSTLVGWNANKAACRNDLRPNLGGSTYTCGSAADTARSALVAYGWTVTDGGCATPALAESKVATAVCDDVICPPGQCCNETVFGFDCRRC
jgi:surface protein